MISNWTMDELRAELGEIRRAIFAYEMSGDTHRIDAANRRLDEVIAEIKRRESA